MMNELIIGSHVQMKAPKYLLGAVEEALSYQANALMLYTGAPQNTKRTDIEKLRIEEMRKLMDENHIDMNHLIIHAPYIINPANSVKPEVADLAVSFLNIEAKRCKAIGARNMVLHPGSFTTATSEIGIATTIKNLNAVDLPDDIIINLETMAGKGSEIGRTFEQLAEILDNLKQSDKYGVCLDTCHIHDAGYNLEQFDDVLDEFDHLIGLQHLHVIHLNDSKNPRGAHKDRHANIGDGQIGFETLCKIAHHPKLTKIPKILETPYIGGVAPYKEEISFLRERTYHPEVFTSEKFTK